MPDVGGKKTILLLQCGEDYHVQKLKFYEGPTKRIMKIVKILLTTSCDRQGENFNMR